MSRCTSCQGRLDVAAVLCDATTCTTCELDRMREAQREDEWVVFCRALREAADERGTISQTRMRPLIAAIPAKHKGLLYRRAMSLGLIEQAGWEPSTDAAGGNADKLQRRYVLRENAAA